MGWLLTALAVVMANWYLWYRYRRHASKLEIRIIEFFQVCLLIPTGLYFILYFSRNIDSVWVQVLSYVAGLYVATLVYSCILFLFFDVLDFIWKHLFKKEQGAFSVSWFHRNFFLFCLAFVIAFYGLWNGTHLEITSYHITMEKRESNLSSLKIAFLSDLHIGGFIRDEEILKIVDRTNEWNPELIVLTGDLFDESSSERQKKLWIQGMKEWNPKYGIYYVYGNHEYLSSTFEEDLKLLEHAGIHVLEDEVVNVEHAFTIVGRKDRLAKRRTLSDLLMETEDLPILLLDHRPYYEDVSDYDREILQLSGHTHNGQIFPFKPFYDLVHLYAYGYYQKPSYDLLVTSGVGMWGIPVRIGSSREIVQVLINFN